MKANLNPPFEGLQQGDPYEGIAGRYDLSFGPFGEQDPHMAGFFRRIFTQNQIHTVLDCACGTARHLPLFHSLGCQVCGSDISETMLSEARKNLSGCGLEIPLYQIDFRELPSLFQQPFDAVICLGAISFMPGEVEFLKAFESMAKVIRPGGLLVLTAMPTDRQWKEKPRFLLTSNRSDFTRLFAIDYFEDRALFNILDVFHSDEQNGLKVWSAEIYPILRDGQERLLSSAGFRAVEFYGAFDGSQYEEELSNSLVTVAFR